MKTKKLKTVDLAYIGLFVALIAICSWISIPTAVPFTLQTLGVFLTISLLGLHRGTLCVFIYILLGAFGCPVFAGFKGGMGALLGSTGGYIIGFLLSAIITGSIINKLGRRIPVLVAAMLIGLLACYVVGTLWFLYVYTKNTGEIGIMTALSWCVFPFIIPDCIKIAIAILLEKRLERFIHIH